MSKVSTLPVWKKDSTPAEWLQELSMMALERPERFSKAIILFVEEEDGRNTTRRHSRGIDNNMELLGTLENAKIDLWAELTGFVEE